jgi:hypothetical protein
MQCGACANGRVVEIRMQVSGSALTFRRCGNCETQHWASPDGHLALDEVLELARQR